MADWFDDEIDEKYDPEQREREEAERRAREEAERLEREEAERERRESERLAREEARLKREREILEKEEYNRRLRRRVAIGEFWEKVRKIAFIALVALVIGGILFGVVFGIVMAIRGISSSVKQGKYEKYSADNIVFSSVSKEADSALLEFDITNNSTLDIEYITGDIIARNVEGEQIVYSTDIYYSGGIASGETKSLNISLSGQEDGDDFYDYPLARLAIEYNIKRIEYSNGKEREYTDGKKILSSATLIESDEAIYSSVNLEFSVTAIDSSSGKIKFNVRNVGALDILYYIGSMNIYDSAGSLIEQIRFNYSGTIGAGVVKALNLSIDSYYYSLDELTVKLSHETITFEGGITNKYPANEIVIHSPSSNNG